MVNLTNNLVTTHLKAARKLIDTPDKWCKNTMSKKTMKWLVIPHYAYCLSGAIERTAESYSSSYYGAVNIVLDAIREKDPTYETWCVPAYFNDNESTTHQDVLDVLDRAIELSKEN